MKERWASLISGGGTTMSEMVKACQTGEVKNIEIACILASSYTAGGIQKAKNLGISEKDIVVVDPNNFLDKNGKVDQAKFSAKLLEVLSVRKVTLVTQNGWMPHTPEEVINAFNGKIFNQHPGPVPEFGGRGMYGRRVHAAILLYRRLTGSEPWTEVIAQRVDKELDGGAVVGKARVEIMPDDSVEDLQQRALPKEHKVQIQLLKDVVSGKVVEMKNKKIVLKEDEEVWKMSKKLAKLLYPKG